MKKFLMFFMVVITTFIYSGTVYTTRTGKYYYPTPEIRGASTVIKLSEEEAISQGKIKFGSTSTSSSSKNIAAFSSSVKYISDGDTMTLSDNRKIRFHGIDAPEITQTYGLEGKEHLMKLIGKKNVTIKVEDIDRYGRTVAVVYVDGVNINLQMVKDGYAWWYREYAKNDKALESAENSARSRKLGLWSKYNPTPPWEYRKNK